MSNDNLLTSEQIQARLPHITKTLGGYDVRDLELIQVKNGNQLLIGELKHPNDPQYSTTNAVWHIMGGFYATWVGGLEDVDIEIISQEELRELKNQKLNLITHTEGGYPVRNLRLTNEDNPDIYFIKGDYFRSDINDWVIDDKWWATGEHLIEPSDYNLNLK